MKIIKDVSLILAAQPHYVIGRRMGLTDEETEDSAQATYNDMEEKETGAYPVRIFFCVNEQLDLFDIVPACGRCKSRIEEKANYCSSCGTKINKVREE